MLLAQPNPPVRSPAVVAAASERGLHACTVLGATAVTIFAPRQAGRAGGVTGRGRRRRSRPYDDPLQRREARSTRATPRRRGLGVVSTDSRGRRVGPVRREI